MKAFGHIKEALREVKRMANEGDYFHEIFLVYDDDNPEYFVTSEESDIEEKIQESYENDYGSPEDEADFWNIWKYDICTDNSLVRTKRCVEVNYDITFRI